MSGIAPPKTTTIKMGVFYNKDTKIVELEGRNKELKQLLAAQLGHFDRLSQELQSSRSASSSLQNQNNLLDIEQMMLRQSIARLQEQLQSLSPEIHKKEQEVQALETEADQLSVELEKVLAEQQGVKNVVTRYREEIRLEKTLSKSQKNMNSVCESLRHNLQNYDRNIQILANKLESKKKYLTILVKKKEKVKKEEEKEVKGKPVQKEVKSYHSTPSINFTTNFQGGPEREREEVQKPCMKKYNEVVRQKNAILARKK